MSRQAENQVREDRERGPCSKPSSLEGHIPSATLDREKEEIGPSVAHAHITRPSAEDPGASLSAETPSGM
jgi:hypothetical protein